MSWIVIQKDDSWVVVDDDADVIVADCGPGSVGKRNAEEIVDLKTLRTASA